MDNDIVVLKPSLFLLLIALCLSLSIVQPSSAQHSPPNVTVAGNPSPSPPPPPNEKPKFSPFRPSMAVIVGVLTTMFSVTFLLLLYAKHCKRGGTFVLGAGAGAGTGDYNNNNHPNSSSYAATAGRKNSGVDRGVVESLPVFRFGALSGHNKEGLECAVCLNRFESAEVLRLLPKCRHAFHVECVDTWLDAHSTCPLCRYRVDPEDILLLDTQPPPPPPPPPPPREEAASDIETGKHSLGFLGRLSGRHSSAGERVSHTADTASYRRSLDSWSWRKKKDSWRKDGLLLSRERDNSKAVGRFEHRIIVSPACGGPQQHQRWSDFQPSDLLYLRSEMIMGEGRGLSSSVSGSRPSVSRQQLLLHSWRKDGKGQESGRSVINSRSVSEITGIERFSNDSNRGRNDTRQRQRQQAGLLSRWVAWVSQLRPAVGSEAINQPQIISP